jgi:hypothetical protein
MTRRSVLKGAAVSTAAANSQGVAYRRPALRKGAAQLADPVGKVLRSFGGVEHRPGQDKKLVLVVGPLHQADSDPPVEPDLMAAWMSLR